MQPLYAIWTIYAVLLLTACSAAYTPAPYNRPDQTQRAPGASHLIQDGVQVSWWKPPVSLRWQWQLDDLPVDLDQPVDLFDIDLFDNDASVVAAIHAQGQRAVCYMSAGSWEAWRPDADQFPESVIGSKYRGWKDEKWLDIRQVELLAPIIRARLDLCHEKGFDGVEPDNIDGYQNDTGFPITYEDQLRYNIWLAAEAHSRGLSIGLKNTPDQVVDLLSIYDWALTENCFAEGWCERTLPFVEQGKPVLAAEYGNATLRFRRFCQEAQQLSINLILKHKSLDAWRFDCPSPAPR